jgi:anti-sigma-K factor RskA
MAKPDLSTPEGLRAYRAEIWRVARWWRWTGLAIVALAALGFVVASKFDLPLLGSPLGLATVAGLAVGWGLAIVGIVKRTRYHKRRMAGWAGNA